MAGVEHRGGSWGSGDGAHGAKNEVWGGFFGGNVVATQTAGGARMGCFALTEGVREFDVSD